MSRAKHEIIFRDGRPMFRSSIDSPVIRNDGDMSDILQQESSFPPDVERYLQDLINLHEESLVRVVGRAWMEDRA